MNPLALLVLGVACHYSWALVPAEYASQWWNASGALTRAVLLVALLWHVRDRWALLVGVWWVLEEAMVAGCSIAYMVSPWVVPVGEAQCSALLQFDLGRLGLACIALILAARKM